MTSSPSIQTPIEPASKPVRKSSITFCGIDVFVTRDGDRVTGRVVFPYPVGGDLAEAERAYREGKRTTGRTECPIDYRSKRPTQSAIHPACASTADRNPQSATVTRVRQKLTAVLTYKALCDACPDGPRKVFAEKVVKTSRADGVARISVRSLQLWTQRFELHGPSALRDRYVKPTKKLPTFDVEHARQALMVCAWWSFRIGNVKSIDTKMMAAVVELLVDGYSAADLLATIDCYYAYRCNRERYPFKPFHRWIKHDLTSWISRAAEAADYRHAVARDRDDRKENTPLLPPARRQPPTVTDTHTRKREALCHRTRAEIAGLADPVSSEQPKPATIADSLLLLSDVWRGMLLRATGPDADRAASDARQHTIATLPMWWDSMPHSITDVIDAKVDQWHTEHPHVTDRACNARRFLMFLPEIRDRSGAAALAVARRIAQ